MKFNGKDEIKNNGFEYETLRKESNEILNTIKNEIDSTNIIEHNDYKEWNENQEIKKIFSRNEILIDKFWKCINEVKKLNDRIILPNIAITYNNKLVEIIQIYREKDFKLYNSSIIHVIIRYLCNYLDKASDCLDNYANLMNKKADDFNYSSKFIKLNELLVMYHDIDNKIFDFDIQKDIQNVLEYDIERYKEIEDDGGYNLYKEDRETIISQYNMELKLLGFDVPLNIPNEQFKNNK